MGTVLADATVDQVLSSNATRARKTTELLSLRAPMNFLARLYNANARQILAEFAWLDDGIRTVLVVAHAPGLPGLIYHLSGPAPTRR